MVILELKGLSKYYGGVRALENIDIRIERGLIVGLIGPNGAGKTTLFSCISGIHRPDSGTITFGDYKDSLVGLAPHEITRRGIGRTFQNIRLFANMSVEENVMVGAHSRTKAALVGAVARWGWVREEEKKIRDFAHELLRIVGLAGYARELAQNLPYGYQRRLEVARALATEPELLLLDEPTAGMNPSEKKNMLELIENIRKQGITILLIEHDMKVVMPISERVIVLDYGIKIAEGKPQDIQKDERVIEAYLGRPQNAKA